MPHDFGVDIAQVQLPVRSRRRQEFGAPGKKLGSAAFIGLAVGEFVANDRMERAAKMRQGERVGGGAVENQEHFAISLENLADLSNQAPGPSIVAVGNFRFRVCFGQCGPGGWADGRGVVARKFEALFRRSHRAFPYATSSRGAIADRLRASRKENRLAKKSGLRRIPPG